MSRVATLALMILAASSPLRKSEVKRKPAIELQTLTGEIDAHLLKAQADSQAAPAKLIYGLAWMETRSGRSGNRARGPGIVVVDSISYYRVSAHGYLPYEHTHRKCREIGRMQLSPCVDWTQLLHDSRCSLKNIKEHYDDNVHCGVRYAVYLHDKYHSWRDVPYHYNGARIYQSAVENYVGKLTLREYQ